MKNVLIISSSLRMKSNSEMLADEFMRGAADAGNNVEKISLRGKDLRFCKGCLACMKTNKCVISDDASAIVEKIRDAEVIAFASPIYYYEMSGQLKTLLDRCNPIFTSNFKFRNIYMLTCAAENDKHVPERAVAGIGGWIDCFDGVRLAGTVFAGGVTDPAEIKGHESLQLAYEMGKSIK